MHLKIKLLSDTAFGRGDGVVGVVNQEIEHDPLTGLPIIKGRTIKGLVVESCADILYALKSSSDTVHDRFTQVAQTLFGQPGSRESAGVLHFTTATLPPDFVLRVRQSSKYKAHKVLEAMTTIRHQTAIDNTRDIPKNGSLRSTRVVLRETIFHAPFLPEDLDDTELAFLAACAAGLRHAGLHRTRGLGHIYVTLEGGNRTHEDYLLHFKKLVEAAR